MFSNTLPTYLPSLTLKILSTLFFLQPVPFSWMSPPTECVPVYNTPTQSMSWVSPQQNMSWVPPATELLCHYNPCPWVLPLTEPLLIFYCHTLREPVFVSLVSSPDKNVSFLSPGYQPTTEYVSVSWVSPPEKKCHVLVVITWENLSLSLVCLSYHLIAHGSGSRFTCYAGFVFFFLIHR